VRCERPLDGVVVRRSRPERDRGGEPRFAVAVLAFGSQTRADGDQLRELRDRADAAGGRDPDEAVRVEVVAEQQRELIVLGSEETGLPVVAEVPLVDRLEPDRVRVVAQQREDRLPFGITPRRGRPQRAFAAGLFRDGAPEVSLG
jgi:hypothetical protein